MKKSHLLISIMLIFMFISIFVCSPLLATEEDNVEQKDAETQAIEKEQLQKKEQANTTIRECIEEIKQQLKLIDQKLSEIREKPEYENYPAIRLNIDTPIFGLVSVVTQKLKITSEVSTADVANSFSIRDVVRNNNIKVPSFSVASIVVITRDIKFDEDITLADANTAILKLMQYINQAKSTNEFLDKQISKIYVGYIPKEKSDKINELNTRINKIDESILNLDKPINLVYVSKINNEKHNEFLDNYLKYKKKSYDLSEKLKNVLLSDEILVELEKQILSLETGLVTLKEQVILEQTKIPENVDVEKMLLEYRTELVNIKNRVEKYIENSIQKREVTQENNIDDQNIDKNEEITDTENNNGEDEDIKTIEEIKMYDATSQDTVEYMNNTIKTIDEKIRTVLGENAYKSLYEEKNVNEQEQIPEEVANKEQVTGEVEKELTAEEKKNLNEELYKIYLEYLTRENKFYLDNINLLLKDTTSKISDLSKYTDTDVISDMRYIYLELPSVLDKQTKIFYNKSSIIGTRNMTSEIAKQLGSLVNSNKRATKAYNNKFSEELKDSSRN